ncbi:MAG: potassium channel family protein [Actinomycetia bacterium]|nr:potassium channel family protein [Actinomycetes bacterium]
MTGEIDRVELPRRRRAPLAAVLRRIGFALGLVVFVALVVRTGRGGYVDVTGNPISFLDALYYASVTVTTTGYGDITAVSTGARFATVVLITPARILFLILVVGTTVEVLTEQSRRLLLTRRWRQRVNDHFVICGFGATGQAAATDLVRRGLDPSRIVAVDRSDEAVERAAHEGYAAVKGDATQNAVLHQAAIERARAVIVVPSRDDTSVLITLTVRELNPDVHIVAGGREQENLHLLRQAGANEVIDATAAVGRMLGLGTYAPGTVPIVDDLLDAGSGLELVEAEPDTSGDRPRVPVGATLVAVIRAGVRVPLHQLDPEDLRPDDRLVVLREG